jgi:hypothetical protein
MTTSVVLQVVQLLRATLYLEVFVEPAVHAFVVRENGVTASPRP